MVFASKQSGPKSTKMEDRSLHESKWRLLGSTDLANPSKRLGTHISSNAAEPSKNRYPGKQIVCWQTPGKQLFAGKQFKQSDWLLVFIAQN